MIEKKLPSKLSVRNYLLSCVGILIVSILFGAAFETRRNHDEIFLAIMFTFLSLGVQLMHCYLIIPFPSEAVENGVEIGNFVVMNVIGIIQNFAFIELIDSNIIMFTIGIIVLCTYWILMTFGINSLSNHC